MVRFTRHLLMVMGMFFVANHGAFAQESEPATPPVNAQNIENATPVINSAPILADPTQQTIQQNSAPSSQDTPTPQQNIEPSSQGAQTNQQTVEPTGQAIEPEQQAAATIPHDLSPMGMFMAADRVVKSVMIALILASIMTWIILVAKSIEIKIAKRKAQMALKIVQNAKNLSELSTILSNKNSASALLVEATQGEIQASSASIDTVGTDGLKERISSMLSRLVSALGRNISVGTGILATIGSISPFVGLFGTVWGIMNSFIGISKTQTTNLAVVAPGIAEALLATALGLVAAIPAVIIYNLFARSITNYRQQLIDVSAGIERLVSRELDLRKATRQTNANPQNNMNKES